MFQPVLELKTNSYQGSAQRSQLMTIYQAPSSLLQQLPRTSAVFTIEGMKDRLGHL